MASNIDQSHQVVVIVVPFPAHGHVNQLLHRSRLILAYNITVHYVSRRVVVIYDSLMAYVVQDAANIANVETYSFHSVSAFTMSLFFWEGMGKPSMENICVPEVPSL